MIMNHKEKNQVYNYNVLKFQQYTFIWFRGLPILIHK